LILLKLARGCSARRPFRTGFAGSSFRAFCNLRCPRLHSAFCILPSAFLHVLCGFRAFPISQGCIKLLDFSLASIGWRRGLGRGGAFLLVSPLLGPLPTRSSRGADGELDAALPVRLLNIFSPIKRT